MNSTAPAAYAEMAAASNFSFLRGASHPQDMLLTALLLGHTGIGIADRNTVAGVVRAHAALRELRESGVPPPDKIRAGGSPGEFVFIEHEWNGEEPPSRDVLRKLAENFKLIVGARLAFADGTPDIIAYPVNRAAWGRLCRLLTAGNRRTKKGDCVLYLSDLLEFVEGLLLIVMPERWLNGLDVLLKRLDAAAPGSVWLSAAMGRRGDDRRRLMRLRAVAQAADVPLIAINDAIYDSPSARDLQDILTCIREGVTIETAGRRLEPNAERHLKSATEMARLFRDAPDAITETQHLLARVDFTLADLKYDYPDEPVPPGWSPQGWLEELTRRRAAIRYPDGIPEKVANLITSELALIKKLDYARYFLTIHDIVRVAEDKGILCQGRGSAANSAVCYALGITSVDPAEHDVLFARFISEERREPPDIDVDFEHERREEIIQYIYERYGRHRAGIAATAICYRPRSAMREVGKALGLTEDITARLTSTQWGSWDSIEDEKIRQTGLDPQNPAIRQALDLAGRLLGFPRHLSQHVGGFVLTRGRLDETVPIGNAAMADRTFIEWNKDDIDELGLMKVDVLALGMLTCIRKAFEFIKKHTGVQHDLASIKSVDDDEVYQMLQRGESLGVFQVESRAQMNMLPRLKPRTFYDLVIQVAIVRPGPIQGDMVHPYLRRRNRLEKVEYPSPSPEHGPGDELFQVLNKTLGVPLFQEQAMHLAMVAAKFSDSEANQLRRAMATFRNVGTIQNFESLMVERMVTRGYDRDFAQRSFEQIKGFGSYGFPESHAASFAKLVYISSWIKHHHPAAFAAALLNSQPMGFYAPAQIVMDAQKNGVEARAVDVNHSFHDNTLEHTGNGTLALRLGFRQIDGIGSELGPKIPDIAALRGDGYPDIETLRARTRLPIPMLHRLADADAFRSMGLDRRAALWAVRRLPDDSALPLFAAADARELGHDAAVSLPDMPLHEHVVADYQTLRLSLKAHPMEFLRPIFRREGISSAAETDKKSNGAYCRMAGIVLVRQRPGNGKAIFITLEDETGITNIVLWARTFERLRGAVMGSRLMLIEGRVQKSPEDVVHLMAENVIDRTDELRRLSEDHTAKIQLTRADEFLHPQHPRNLSTHPRNVRVILKSRDFH
ncbi:error-prone DNA polymerase [Variibacter gotjawalensis]|uniref:Error-prone DNA polymerase n=1 Tax=Variibacter gotjawalensis TaxID=1333996 RepID=A0A0S3PRF3_9BRAD|nr:error-prone DNA polymerase [Variibacter gotjawalensis]NIK48826.1 error-prone DNA polymerase [Variibacter gotjawalensis]RZS50686.1 DnaE-like error-prone DNA polymerase [Variibacter gotjawalensis]BAT58520.1 error-prone DNA polymerase [Variibacter gotjawalensis]